MSLCVSNRLELKTKILILPRKTNTIINFFNLLKHTNSFFSGKKRNNALFVVKWNDDHAGRMARSAPSIGVHVSNRFYFFIE